MMITSASSQPLEAETVGRLPLIEIGWLVIGPLDRADSQAIEKAREQSCAVLRERFGQFHWKMSFVQRDQLGFEPRAEPVALLTQGVAERDLRRWDFTVIVTGADLVSYYRNEAVAAVSRSLEGIAISTLRLDPRVNEIDVEDERRVSLLASRITALVMHALGHQVGLAHVDDDRNFMSLLETLADLDRVATFSPQQQEQMARELGEIADRRLEETPARRTPRPVFYLKSGWLNRREISAAILEARPWEMPYRLSGLMTAAVSTMLVLIMSSEAWDLAVEQPFWLVAALSVLSIGTTTGFLLLRQRLLVRRGHVPLGEQTVTTNVATVAIVLLGILTSYLAVFLLGLGCGLLFFTRDVVESWTGGTTAGGLTVYLKPVGFSAALAMLIGALGATFDRNHYFRHVTAVDEEI